MHSEYSIIIFLYSAMSILTFCLYGLDKSAAKQNKWRIKESTLHIMSVFFGWPGGIAGQRVFRHKTKKRLFQWMFWLTLILNLVLLYGMYFVLF